MASTCKTIVSGVLVGCSQIITEVKLEQLERLRSEIPPTAPWLPILVVHIRSQVKTRQIQILKNCQKIKFWNFARNFTRDKMYKYEMDPTRTVGTTERTQDGRTDWNQYTPQQLRCVVGITRTIRTPAFWDTASWLRILVIHIRSQVKTRQRWTDEQTHGWTEWNQYTPNNFVGRGV